MMIQSYPNRNTQPPQNLSQSQFNEFQSEKVINEFSYNINNLIGKGQFSKVYQGRNTMNGVEVAVKVTKLSEITDQVFMKMIQNEIAIMKMVEGPNLLKMFQEYTTLQNKYLITEMCEQGDLNNYIKQRVRLNEKEALNILKHLLLGLHQIQKALIIHRDIKPANIFISNGVPKIADFGFAVQKYLTSSNDMGHYNVGTPLYMSPESLISNTYSFKSDIWSLGIVLYEMLVGKTPFISATEDKLRVQLQEYKQSTLYLPPEIVISPQMYDLLQKMLRYDHTKRPSVTEIFQHSCIALMNSNSLSSCQSQPTSARLNNREFDVPEIPDEAQTQRPHARTTFLVKRLSIITMPTQKIKEFLVKCYDTLTQESSQSLLDVRLSNITLQYGIVLLIQIQCGCDSQNKELLRIVKQNSDFKSVVQLREQNFMRILNQPNDTLIFYKSFQSIVEKRLIGIRTLVGLRIDNIENKNQEGLRDQVNSLCYMVNLMRIIRGKGDNKDIDLDLNEFKDRICKQDWFNINQQINELINN